MPADDSSALVTLVDAYLEAWNERDAERRQVLVEAVWSSEGELVDPPSAGRGHAGIVQHIQALHEQFPGHRFRRASNIDAHNDCLRFAWQLVGPDGSLAIDGMDVGVVGADGRLLRICGFFGKLESAGDEAATAGIDPST